MPQNISSFLPGEVYTNDDIYQNFWGDTVSGVRYSSVYNHIVVISKYDSKNSPYQDTWDNYTLYYTGTGKKGDQTESKNKRLINANKEKMPVYLFESFNAGEYTYRGQVYVGTVYKDNEEDSSGNTREVYKFPLTLQDKNSLIEKNIIDRCTKKEIIIISKLSEKDLSKRAKINSQINIRRSEKSNGTKYHAKNRFVKSQIFERDIYIAEYVKKIANGHCQLCDQPAPFIDDKGTPFLHSHHIKYLSEGGLDTIDNSIAVCPNCHAKIHHLKSKEKEYRKILTQKVQSRQSN
ncbi:HNH endonuclease [Apilactobacillus kunkeei]|uniref:HNH endonuclease n=1 Tax=Apilactobacillus kunkeei TaxID=148814 RepID=UPI001C8AC198|nr:HNH endonuclease [Apilactobacillus kunkeei]MBX8456246.1 HNH endonuclease [Apilactobacillus kunkeei]